MVNYQIDLKLTPQKLENISNVKSIRLVSENGRIHIASLAGGTHLSEHLVSVSPIINDDNTITESPHLVFKLDTEFGATPSWDITKDQSGTVAVWTKPRSATVLLGYQRLGNEKIILAGEDPWGVFQRPRFVRGIRTVAITAAGQRGTIVLFRNKVEASHAQYEPLPSLGGGVNLVAGLLLQRGSSYFFVTKHLLSGSRGPERTDLRGESIPSGLLRCLQLNADLQPVGAATSPIGDTEIFEFDVDISGDKLFLLATTKKGYIGAVATASNQSLQWTTTGDKPSDGDLSSPSVLVSGKTAIAAAIESILEYGMPRRHQLLTGQYKH